jgi:uncharacterized protein (DUF58 family)
MGVSLGVLLATALTATDIAGLAGVMARSIGLLAGFALLATLLGMAFGFMAAATAIMLPRSPGQAGGRGPVPALVPIEVRTRPVRRLKAPFRHSS